jgi:putative spermidine/putrescine transport system substrate-binding protein
MMDTETRSASRPAVSRRAVLGGLGAAALSARAARAEDQTVVVGTWGGDYARLLHENVEVPLLEPKGIKVVQDVGDEPPRVAKIMASRRLPRGAQDVSCMSPTSAYLLADQGLLAPVDATNIPNLAHADKAMVTANFVPHIWSPQILIYNPDVLTTPPKSFSDLLDPKYAGKIGFPDGNNLYAMMAANLLAGGTPGTLDKARPTIEKLVANGVRLYPSTDSIAQAFNSGEIVLGVMWMARVFMWQNAKVKVASTFPKEGSILYVSGMVAPKNAPNLSGAYAYLDAALAPSAQRGFAANMGYNPTVSDAALTGDLAKRLALPDPAPRLIVPDYVANAKVKLQLDDWWKKTTSRS